MATRPYAALRRVRGERVRARGAEVSTASRRGWSLTSFSRTGFAPLRSRVVCDSNFSTDGSTFT